MIGRKVAQAKNGAIHEAALQSYKCCMIDSDYYLWTKDCLHT